MRIRWTATAVATLVAVSWTNEAHALLTYNLSSDMVKSGCAGDADNDCLDDALEGALALSVVPWYYYDEDESCSWKQNSLHYSRKDFFQVRPHGAGVASWTPTSGGAKWVQITYFFLHPHDCQSYLGWGGHAGDSEKVDYHLYSYDLRRWYLATTRYWHHHDPYHDFSGTYQQNLATALGTSWASVAADEDGHGSWPGRAAGSEDCAGDEDHFYNDCFKGGSMRNALWYYSEVPGVFRNIGGPWPERWNPSVLGVYGDQAWSSFDVGHYTQTEYWNYAPPFQQFCGWECSYRNSNGSCYWTLHEDSGDCSSGLHEKTDKYVYSKGVCGDAWCDGSESCASCASDCGSCYCGDYVCTPGEDTYWCPSDCSVCGDYYCSPYEDTWSCSFDCGGGGYCGDWYCDWAIGEDQWSCPYDCGGQEYY